MKINRPRSMLLAMSADIMATIEKDNIIINELIKQNLNKSCEFTVFIDGNELKCEAFIPFDVIVNSIKSRISKNSTELKNLIDELGMKQKQDYEF